MIRTDDEPIGTLIGSSIYGGFLRVSRMFEPIALIFLS